MLHEEELRESTRLPINRDRQERDAGLLNCVGECFSGETGNGKQASWFEPVAEEAGVSINIENIFANGFLFSPQEAVEFVDSFESDHVKVHFDTGNIMHYQFPEHWVPILGKRIKNIHFKEWDKRTQEFNLHTFRTLLDGTTNWPAVIEELDKTGYQGYLTFEYFHPFNYPEALLIQTSAALDRMLGRMA